ncbi:energy-coupling factor transporter ATP-binding protein EcfA2 [Clostridia bacterium]|nr:energy-coupling factor transporter ATP-binding protein EcfA2 [Clostridia bacterium]
MNTILETRGLTYVYGKHTPFERVAVDNVDFSLEDGELRGIIGHTGSGKSTLIQHFNGLLKPESGQVLLGGEDIRESKDSVRRARFRVGLVFQYPEYQLFEETVAADIAFGPKNMGLAGAELDDRVNEAMGFAGLSEQLRDKSPFELSGGQKRRVAIAGVIAMRPQVLVLDEPTAGLDPRGADGILERIRAYHRERGGAVVLVTHSMDELARMADTVTVLSGAKVLAEGTTRQVFAQADILGEHGLSVPAVTAVFGRMRALGLNIEGTPLTIGEAADLIMGLKNA